MFVYEYWDDEGFWFDINFILKDVVELKKWLILIKMKLNYYLS